MFSRKKYKMAMQSIDLCEDFYRHTLDYWEGIKEKCTGTIHECRMHEIEAEIQYYKGGLHAICTVKKLINQNCEGS